MNLGTVNGPSETKPNAENYKNCLSKCAYDSAQLSVHNTAQNSSDNLPYYLQPTIIAQITRCCLSEEKGSNTDRPAECLSANTTATQRDAPKDGQAPSR